MKALKIIFLGRLMREKLLILALLVLAFAIWFSSFSKRAQNFGNAFASTSTDLETNAMWLGRKDSIEAESKRSIARLDPAQTLDGTKLLAEVNRIAAQVGLSNVQMDDMKDETSAQFSVHTLRFTVTRASYGTLVRFYQEIQKRSPYIGIEQFAIQAAPSNASQLTATLRLSSVQVQR